MNDITRDRLLLSAAVLLAASMVVTPFLLMISEWSNHKQFFADCIAREARNFDSCSSGASGARTLALYLYLSPLIVPGIALWSKWVWKIPYPTNPPLFSNRGYRIFEGLLFFLSFLVVLNNLYSAAFEAIPSGYEPAIKSTILYPVYFMISILLFSSLLDRESAARKFARGTLILALMTPIIGIGIQLARL